jgi:hypothetical protein
MNFGPLKKELRDQSAHMAAGAIAVVPATVLGLSPLSLAWITFCMGMVREVGEEGKPVTFAKIYKALGSRRDLTFWALIGALVGLAAWAVQG